MDTFGRYRLIYEPGPPDPGSEIIDYSVEMSISAEARLPEMLSFIDSFIRACGYVFDGELQIVSLSEEEEDYFDSRDYWKEKFFSLLNSPG
jgi:hypothetical protein